MKISHYHAIAAAAFSAVLLAGADGLGAAPVARTGTVQVTGTLTIGSNVAADATITGTVRLNAGGTRSIIKSAVLVRNGNKATMTVTLPYAWELDAVSNVLPKLLVSFGASASAPNFVSTNVVVYYDFPANGATTKVTIPGSI